MYDAVVQYKIAPQQLPRMRTNGCIRNGGRGAIYNLPVSFSTHGKTAIQQVSGVCIFLGIGCGGGI